MKERKDFFTIMANQTNKKEIEEIILDLPYFEEIETREEKEDFENLLAELIYTKKPMKIDKIQRILRIRNIERFKKNLKNEGETIANYFLVNGKIKINEDEIQWINKHTNN